MKNEPKILVKDYNFSEDELKIIDSLITFFIPLHERKPISEYRISNILEFLNKALEDPAKIDNILPQSRNIIHYTTSLRYHIDNILPSYIMVKKSFKILGICSKNDISSFPDEKYLIIRASNLDEAKEIRDKKEAETYSINNISIEKLLTIINSMERVHDSSYISLEILKKLIKNI